MTRHRLKRNLITINPDITVRDEHNNNLWSWAWKQRDGLKMLDKTMLVPFWKRATYTTATMKKAGGCRLTEKKKNSTIKKHCFLLALNSSDPAPWPETYHCCILP